ncbi:MAG: aminodeoxychorismate synthase component I [Pseudomonadota bacterium]
MHLRALGRAVDLLALHVSQPDRYPYLLQSAASAAREPGFDILFRATGSAERFRLPDLSGLRDTLPSEVPESAPVGLPFYGGWFCYFGYECVAAFEPHLSLPTRIELPVALLHRAPAAIVVDRSTGIAYAVAETGAQRFLAELERDAKIAPYRQCASLGPHSLHEPEADAFVAAAESALRYIAAGEVYQVNLSRRWEATFAEAPSAADLYCQLLRSNPAPFAGLMRIDDHAVVSSSPERLLRLRGRAVDTRPIAGTRPRGYGGTADRRLRAELVASEKEQAEHVMLIDLERNDLGRIAVPGSVEVDEWMVVESYAHVHHIVSNVKATLASGVGPVDVLEAVFPGGTITGCPKLRCIEIIAELEREPRGPYTGSFGYINGDGSMDLNILIRTVHLHGATATFRAGAGIVADSVPSDEVRETRSKALGLINALSAAAA